MKNENDDILQEERNNVRACQRVKSAIENWYLCGENGDILPIINAIRLEPEMRVAVPARIPEAFFGNKPAEELQQGDTFTLEEDMGIPIPRIPLPDGRYLTPVFTDLDELMRGEAVDSITVPFSTLMDLAESWENCAGIVINPRGNGCQLPKKMFHAIRDYTPMSRFVLVKGDITKFHGDAIVNAARHSLLGGGGVDGVIHRAAGPELLEECRTLKGCRTGEAKMTGGYNLPAEHVIHTVGPRYGKDKDPEGLLASCYFNCLDLARKNDLRSIVFPCISTGAFGFPKDAAARIALSAVCWWFDHNPDYVMNVYFCCHSDEDISPYRKLSWS